MECNKAYILMFPCDDQFPYCKLLAVMLSNNEQHIVSLCV